MRDVTMDKNNDFQKIGARKFPSAWFLKKAG
jgi:hypothetical protein